MIDRWHGIYFSQDNIALEGSEDEGVTQHMTGKFCTFY